MTGKSLFTRHLFFYLLLPLALLSGVQCSSSGNKPDVKPHPTQPSATFTNPVLRNASDPWVLKKDSTYYYMNTTGGDIRLRQTKSMARLASAASHIVYTPARGAQNSENIWAPEIHYLDGKWYIYYTAGNGQDKTQRTWVLENSSADPLKGSWTDKGRIYHKQADFWAIDGTILEHKGKRYFLWSGRPGAENDLLTQNLYIALMADPWTLTGEASMLSEPEHHWERKGFAVNEGPQALIGPGNKVYIVYSASYCGSDDYSLGLLSLKEGGDPLKAGDWTKAPVPVFKGLAQHNAYAPGHNAFFKSQDGNEDWIIYHANSNAGEGCADKRTIRIQKFTFNTSTGLPAFGEPVATGLTINLPSGEK